MNRRDERPDGPDDRGPAASDSSAGGGRGALVVVSVLLFGEAVLVTVLLGWLLIDLFSLEPSSMATAVALTVL
ncbi:MAG TPA: hypothetical protein VGE78_06500, partial [Agromyces sp.]